MKNRMVVISYIPLLEGYSSNMNKEELLERLKTVDTNLGTIRHCLWAGSDIGPYPVFVTKDAKKIVDHLTFWAGNNVQNWFDLCIIDKGEKYFILLWPNLIKSKDRHLYNHMVVNEEIIIESEWDFTFMFCPLSFMSMGRGTLDKVKESIQEETYLGFIDTNDFNLDNPIDTKTEPIPVGPLKVYYKHEFAEKYLEKYLENL